MPKDKYKQLLDPYEAELEKELDKAVPLDASQKKAHESTLEQAARKHVKKDKRITIRVYGSDLEELKKIAEREGLPYQTLITSVLHKYATGLLSSRRQF